MIQRDHALILRTWPLRETSRIVAALTRDNGKVRLVARGVRGPRSRAGASLEPGNEVELVFHQKPGRDLGQLRESTLVEAWLARSTRLDAMAVGWACLELLDRVVPDGAPSGGLLDLAWGVLQGLRRSQRREDAVLQLYAFELALLGELGQAPDLGSCRLCGDDARGAMWLDVEAASLDCAACRQRGTRALPLPASAVRLLARLAEGAEASPGLASRPTDRRSIGLALHRLLAHHVERYRYPRSLQLLKSTSGATAEVGAADPGHAEASSRVAEDSWPPHSTDHF
jgi:DNA repair protein RecO (recombination protein O)